MATLLRGVSACWTRATLASVPILRKRDTHTHHPRHGRRQSHDAGRFQTLLRRTRWWWWWCCIAKRQIRGAQSQPLRWSPHPRCSIRHRIRRHWLLADVFARARMTKTKAQQQARQSSTAVHPLQNNNNKGMSGIKLPWHPPTDDDGHAPAATASRNSRFLFFSVISFFQFPRTPETAHRSRTPAFDQRDPPLPPFVKTDRKSAPRCNYRQPFGRG